ncbi:MAG: magnesium transporter [Ferruginibacter sp.]|nr:magnesium transporter [Cytophagales bacterium]
MPFELTKEYVGKIAEAIEQRDVATLTAELEELYPADISEILYELDEEQSKYVIQLLDQAVGAEIISNMDPTLRKDLFKLFGSEEIAQFMNYVDSDDAADILNEQPIRVREEVIALVKDRQKARYIIDLLHYDEDCAGGLMAKELVQANVNWTILRCIEEIRRQAEKVEKVLSVYVVDDAGILLGRVSLKKLILARGEKHLSDIYDDDLISVETYRPVEEVADLMQRYDLESIPVVNVQGRLLGRITIDDIVDVITEQADLDRQAMTGLSAEVEEDDSVWMLSRARLPWLFIGMVGGLLGSRFIGLFEADIAIIPAMASFIPIITATGGNVGIQSSSIILQSLASKMGFDKSFSERLWKVFLVALLNGFIISGFVLGFNVLVGLPVRLGLVVSTALFSVVLLSSFMGTLTPLALDRLGVNPAVASGPFITTTNDLIGLAVYFSVAHVLYDF